MMISVINRVENFVGKGENAGYQHFLLFPQCFQKSRLFGRGLSFTCTCITYITLQQHTFHKTLLPFWLLLQYYHFHCLLQSPCSL